MTARNQRISLWSLRALKRCVLRKCLEAFMSPVITENEEVICSSELAEVMQSILSGNNVELPVLPEVATRVLEMTSDIDCDPRELVELIRRDQSMATHLMRVANSARYSSGVELSSVQQAIARLGLICVRELTVLIACETRIFDVAGFEKQVRQSFRRSLTVAAYTQELARIRRHNVEEAFMAGLMHDVGRPVLLQALSDARKIHELKDPDDVLLQLADRHRVSMAAELIESWQLPVRLADAVRNQKSPEQSEQCFDVAGVLNLAIELGRQTLENGEAPDSDSFEHPMIEALNLYGEQVEEVLCKGQEILEWVDSAS